MVRAYKALNIQSSSKGNYSIVPIRHDDMYDIMQWRNEQIYHLRQDKPLTKIGQETYFNTVVRELFNKPQPSQLLFSYLENDICIGYGGLVHINWTDRNAEISFIMKTELEKDYFHFHWQTYLSLIEKIAFDDLKLHKIYTYAFDLRPHLYEALESADYIREATLKEQCYFNEEFKDVVIHSKNSNNYGLTLKNASIDDCNLLFKWANDPTVRELSFNSSAIEYKTHQQWFRNKLNNQECSIYIFYFDNTPVGQVRIEKDSTHPIIGISLDKNYRGQNLAPVLLRKAINKYWLDNNKDIIAYIKPNNKASIKAFEICGFKFKQTTTVEGCFALKYIIKKKL